jgi:hypothetical protein
MYVTEKGVYVRLYILTRKRSRKVEVMWVKIRCFTILYGFGPGRDPEPPLPPQVTITVHNYIINDASFPYTAQNHQFDFYERIINFYSFN